MFGPEENGFGFRNWSPASQYFEAPSEPSRASIRERIRTGWRDRSRELIGLDTSELPARAADAIATQLRLAVVQRAGTNGHCYGMVLAAQQYFERPETIPVDRRTASEIEDPTVPVEEPTAPVYEDIVRLQAEQYLRFRPWLGRRALLRPAWIDTGAVLRDVRSVIDALGSATLTLYDGSLYAHQVLGYRYEGVGDGTVISIYDPNRPAVTYRGERPALRFTRDGDTVSMDAYGRYTGVLFNRYDRIERATDREDASPLDHLTVDRSTLRASLFPLALVMVDTADVELTVVAPDGEELDRVRGTYMDRTREEYARVRSRYGATPGTYRIAVFGEDQVDYEVTTIVADDDGVVVDTTHDGTIEPGEFHEYDLEIAGSGRGSMDRQDGRLQRATLVGAGAVGGMAVGALGYRGMRQRRERDRIDERSP